MHKIKKTASAVVDNRINESVQLNQIDCDKEINFVRPETISFEEFNTKMKSLRTLSDVTAFTKSLVAPTIQAMLEAEMDNHLGYSKHNNSGDLSGNSRNGYYQKSIKTSDAGKVTVGIPRDRNGEFVPLVSHSFNFY